MVDLVCIIYVVLLFLKVFIKVILKWYLNIELFNSFCFFIIFFYESFYCYNYINLVCFVVICNLLFLYSNIIDIGFFVGIFVILVGFFGGVILLRIFFINIFIFLLLFMFVNWIVILVIVESCWVGGVLLFICIIREYFMIVL